MKITLVGLLKKAPIHVLFWFLVWGFFTVFFSAGSQDSSFIFSFSITLSVTAIICSYMVVYNLIPNYLLKKKYGYFALYVVYILIVIFFVVEMTIFIGFTFYFNLEYQHMPGLTKSYPVITVCLLLIVSLASAIKLIKHNYVTQDKNRVLENKFLQTQLQLKEQELQFLKMQIHPHFLFNSLNTIYGFTLAKKEEAPEMILKLSNLLDYILYQIDKPGVPLKSELEHIEDYISLEKMRFHDTLKVSFRIEPLKSDVQVAPMLLIPFVENGFKHGAIIDGFLHIDILAKEEHGFFVFQMKNSCQKSEGETKGIGLDNIRKRLEMLYADRYELEVNQEANEFCVELKIQLSDQKTIEDA